MWLLSEFTEMQNTVRESQCRPAMQGIADEILQVPPAWSSTFTACLANAPHLMHRTGLTLQAVLSRVQHTQQSN